MKLTKEQETGEGTAGPNTSLRRKLRAGYIVLGALVSVKIVEYLVAKIVPAGDWPFLVILALASAWLIIYYYKHINQLWHYRGKDSE